MVMAWTNELSIGITAVDAQHKGIIETLERLCKTAADGGSWEATLTLSGDMIDLFESHFISEETFMRSIRYPGVDAHMVAHSAFFTDFSGLVYRIEKHDGSVVGDLVKCVRRWAFEHVDILDREIARYVAETEEVPTP